MNIQEFVKSVLVDIDHAVSEARTEMKRDIYFSSTKDQRTVEFDMAVSVEKTNTKNGKAGVRVLPFTEMGGNLGQENKNSTVSRIRFGVSISGQTKEEEKSWENYNKSLEDVNY